MHWFKNVTFVAALVVSFLAQAPAWAGDRPERSTQNPNLVTRQVAEGAITPPDPTRHVPDEVLVRFRPHVSAKRADRAIAAISAAKGRRFSSVNNLYRVKLLKEVSLHRAIKKLRKNADVLYAEPNYIVEAFATPTDPRFPEQWALHNTGQTGGTADADIDAVEAWDVTTGSSSVVVAVIDTGVDYTHEDLAANVFRNAADCNSDGIDDDGNGYVDDCHGIDTVNHDADPFDDEGHGTHVAGIIGAEGNNGIGVAGVAWQTTILPCKFLDAEGYGNTADAVVCLDYVASLKDRGVNIVATNNSWGGGLYSQALVDAIAAQRERGILFIASAGNYSVNNDVFRSYPCSYPNSNVICVAATEHQDFKAGFSNYGRRTVHLQAPGVAILSTTPGDTYAAFSGTSMAAPHVSGVAALLHAQQPAQDWRVVKNLIIAGGDTISAAPYWISGNRLNALGSMNCSDSVVLSSLRPLPGPGNRILRGLGSTIELAALHINCGQPNGEVNVTITPGDDTVTLYDNGTGRDETFGDGIYTATWTPPAAGTYTLAFPDGATVLVDVDPHLEIGFPVQSFVGGGEYTSGPGVHTLVGNIDDDPDFEIVTTGLGSGPLYAWKADGSLVPGWPAVAVWGAAYPALGNLDHAEAEYEIFSGHRGLPGGLVAYDGTGTPLPGWPQNSANFVSSPPSLADIDNDGLDEIFIGEEDWSLHAYRADGTIVPGWPRRGSGGQQRHTPAIADLDGDSDLEIVTASGWTTPGVYLFAYHHDGTTVQGFPLLFQGKASTYPVVGDVDGDGVPEIVLYARVDRGDGFWIDGVLIVSAEGVVERSMVTSGRTGFGSAPALADLDSDGIPEIIAQTDTAVNVWKGNGDALSGWPQAVGQNWLENTSPVVGDIDGDGQPEIVVLALSPAGNAGQLLAFRPDGTAHPSFPKVLPLVGAGAVPAIADIDRDGRNEIIVTGAYWDGHSGYYDKVWVYDFGGPAHGPSLWGQFMGGPKHHGTPQPQLPEADPRFKLTVVATGTGTGSVTSLPAGIDCGADCSESFSAGASVTLTATPAPGSEFTGWDGACSGQTDPCTITLDDSKRVTARFEVFYTITTATAGDGNGIILSSPDGIQCGPDCSETYKRGTSIALTASPAEDSAFTGWTGACAGQGNPCTLTVNADASITATFVRLAGLTVTLTGGGRGTVTSVPSGISCGSDCSEYYFRDTNVTLTASPVDNYQVFTGWDGACAGQSNPCTLTLTADTDVTAIFQPRYTLRVNVPTGYGTIISNPSGINCGGDCNETYLGGTVVTLNALPAPGYAFAGWTGIYTGIPGACDGQWTLCTLTMDAFKTAAARFAPAVTLTVGTSGKGTGTIVTEPAGIQCGTDCSEPFALNSTVTVRIIPDEGSTFRGWRGACSGQGNLCTLVMDEDKSTTAKLR